MEAFEVASKNETIVEISTTVERPAPLSESLKNGKVSLATGHRPLDGRTEAVRRRRS